MVITESENLECMLRIAGRSAELAGAALARLVRSDIRVSILQAQMVPLPEVPNCLGEEAAEAVGLYCQIAGDLGGSCTILLSGDNSRKLSELLLRQACVASMHGISEPEQLPLRRSALEETANIVIASFLNGIAEHLGVRVIPGVPQMLHDMYGAVADAMVFAAAQESDRVLVFKTVLNRDGEYADAVLLYVPDAQSLRILEGASHVC